MSTDNPYASPSAERAAPVVAPHLEPPQSVSFQLTEEEVLAAVRHIYSMNQTFDRLIRRRQKQLALTTLILAVLGMLFLQDESVRFVGIVICSVAFGYFLLAIFYRSRAEKGALRYAKESLVDEANPFDRKLRATLVAEGFETSDENGHSFRKWKAVPKVERIGKLLLIYETTASAHPIPSRAFYDEAAFEGYAALAKRLWSAAHLEPVGENGEVNV